MPNSYLIENVITPALETLQNAYRESQYTPAERPILLALAAVTRLHDEMVQNEIIGSLYDPAEFCSAI
jgi:hypothetical protein